MFEFRRRDRAFTLIELLVVVAIIALLIAVLLPALARAREQARIAVCLANLHTIANAQSAYLNDFDDLPWVMPWDFSASGVSYPYRIATPYVWGGALPDRTTADWDTTGVLPAPGDGLFPADFIAIPPRYRPLNRYVSSHVSWDRERFDDAERPANTPGFFRCPSDRSLDIAIVDVGLGRDDSGVYTAADFLGTSYGINCYWPRYYFGTPEGKRYEGFGGLAWHAMQGGIYGTPGAGRLLLRSRVERWQAEFVTFMENPFLAASEGALPRGAANTRAVSLAGWHGRQDYHTALFLDGHAQHRLFDTRYVDGPGWTTWPPRPWRGDWTQYEDR
jgi:prepilin-type N-terminal cleavage/methylation domain-containing protein